MPQRHASAHELRQLPPFAHLSKQELRLLERLRTNISVPPGTVLARQGHPCLEFGIVVEGTARGDPRRARDRPPRVWTALRRDRDRSCRPQPGDDRGLHCRDTGGHERSRSSARRTRRCLRYETTSMIRSIAGSRPGWVRGHPFPLPSGSGLSCLRTRRATPWRHDASSQDCGRKARDVVRADFCRDLSTGDRERLITLLASLADQHFPTSNVIRPSPNGSHFSMARAPRDATVGPGTVPELCICDAERPSERARMYTSFLQQPGGVEVQLVKYD